MLSAGFAAVSHLVLTLAQQLLFAEVVDPQQFADSDQDSALERRDGQGHVLHGGLPITTLIQLFKAFG